MKIGFVITGRMKSTRLPKKLTLKLQDRELIRWMLDRAKLAFEKENIVIATSTNPQDDILEVIANEEEVKVFRGDEEDVVERLYQASLSNGFDYLINITADCPLFGYDYIDKIKDVLVKESPDLLTSLDLPIGFFVYAIKTTAFKKVIQQKKTTITEVWGDYFYSNPDIFKVVSLQVEEDEKRIYRLTIDYPEDFKLFEAIFGHFGKDTYKTSSKDILEYLDTHSEIAEINKECNQKYKERWESQRATQIEKK
jgi:spore coat polysaccharide biosynthesis protein SpsF